MAVEARYQKREWLFLQRNLFRETCLLILLVTAAAASEQCPQFVFPTVPSNRTITANEHSRLTLPFALSTDACPEQENQTFFIYVAKGPQRNEGDFCIVRVMGEEYLSYNEDKCSVWREDGREGVDFVKTVTRADSGTWLWRTGDGRVRAEVYFNIQGSSRSSDDNINEDTDAEPTLALAGKQTTTKRFNPRTYKPPAADDKPDENVGKKANASNKNIKIRHQPDRDQETGKVDENGNAEKKMKEKSSDDNDDDDDDERPTDGSVTTGVIVGMVNVVTIIVVVVVVFFLVRRHSRSKRHPRDSMPPLPNDARLPGLRQETSGDVTNKYSTIESVTSSHYEPLPEPRESIAVDKDGYLEPEKAKEDVSEGYIELIS